MWNIYSLGHVIKCPSSCPLKLTYLTLSRIASHYISRCSLFTHVYLLDNTTWVRIHTNYIAKPFQNLRKKETCVSSWDFQSQEHWYTWSILFLLLVITWVSLFCRYWAMHWEYIWYMKINVLTTNTQSACCCGPSNKSQKMRLPKKISPIY